MFDPIEKMRETGKELEQEPVYTPLDIEMEDGSIQTFWVNGIIIYPKDNKQYSLLLPASSDENGQLVDPNTEESDGQQRRAMLVRIVQEENGDSTLEPIDPDDEIVGELINQFHDEGWIRFPEDDDAEEEFNNFVDETMKNRELNKGKNRGNV